MRVLLSKATPQNQVSLMTALGNQLRRVSLMSAVQPGISRDQQQQQRQATPAFAARHNDLSALAPRAASYGGAARQSAVAVKRRFRCASRAGQARNRAWL